MLHARHMPLSLRRSARRTQPLTWAWIVTLALSGLGLSPIAAGQSSDAAATRILTGLSEPRPTALPRLLLATADNAANPAAANQAIAPDTAPTMAAPAITATPERTQCLQQCALASGQCNSEVRQARQECSRNAANAGRDPLSMRNDEYAYFCSYFTHPGRCASGDCQRRFRGHLNVCLNVMQKNIASMRHDCFRNERDAQRICRTELRACEASCPQ